MDTTKTKLIKLAVICLICIGIVTILALVIDKTFQEWKQNARYGLKADDFKK